MGVPSWNLNWFPTGWDTLRSPVLIAPVSPDYAEFKGRIASEGVSCEPRHFHVDSKDMLPGIAGHVWATVHYGDSKHRKLLHIQFEKSVGIHCFRVFRRKNAELGAFAVSRAKALVIGDKVIVEANMRQEHWGDRVDIAALRFLAASLNTFLRPFGINFMVPNQALFVMQKETFDVLFVPHRTKTRSKGSTTISTPAP